MTRFFISTALLVLTVFLTTTVGYGQTIIGEWTMTSSINKKFSKKKCYPSPSKYRITFFEDGTYTYVTGAYNPDNGQQYYTEGKFKLDSISKTLALFENKLMPNGSTNNLPDITYRLISISKTTLSLNECWCVESEYDEPVSDNCITKYKKAK